jgi:hypothetical protein
MGIELIFWRLLQIILYYICSCVHYKYSVGGGQLNHSRCHSLKLVLFQAIKKSRYSYMEKSIKIYN